MVAPNQMTQAATQGLPYECDGYLVTRSSCHLVAFVGYNVGMNTQRNIYELAGGDAPFRRLIEAFYAGIEHEPLLRPLYPDDLAASKEHMFLFVTQYFGAPPRYNALRGHPRLRMRHAPFAIGQAERDAWVQHMLAAIDAAGFAEPARSTLIEYFENAATFMINQAAPGSIDLQG
jgi:hemoglobin